MQIGRVIGRLWCTVKNPALEAHRLLLVQPLNGELAPSGRVLVCTDSTGAGAGELIYWVRGREATFPFAPDEPATDATIVGIIDEVNLGTRVEKA